MPGDRVVVSNSPTSAYARRRLSSTRLVVVLAALGIGATVLCAGLGFSLARESDQRYAIERREALRGALAEFRALFGDGSQVDPRFVHVIEQSTGLKDLKFEAEPTAGQREMQPVLDSQGRIAGFLTWRPDGPMMETMTRLMPFLAFAALGLVVFACVSLLQLRRARLVLAESAEETRRAAEEDALTGLPNRRKILALLKEAMAERLGGKPLILALIELTGLNDIDEEIGPIHRDAYVAEALLATQTHLPPGAVLGRMSAAEFALICAAEIDARALLRSMIGSIADFPAAGTDLRIAAVAGYAQAPRDATSSEELLRRARLALRAAGDKGPGIVTAFEHSLDVVSKDQHFVRRELPRAIAAEALELHYQPIVTSDGARVVGVEALLRWNHPERGTIGPSIFVPIAEQMGLMDTLGAFVLRRALSEAKRWPDLYISVNLSPVQARDRAVIDVVRNALGESGVEPSRLVLEVTEGVLIE
ncbi:MAG: EAL domain-containing protein, partial [Pseudolabrys sp.]|nr:EAL domain-containing protein [Pseudolabrys sp.]